MPATKPFHASKLLDSLNIYDVDGLVFGLEGSERVYILLVETYTTCGDKYNHNSLYNKLLAQQQTFLQECLTDSCVTIANASFNCSTQTISRKCVILSISETVWGSSSLTMKAGRRYIHSVLLQTGCILTPSP